MTRRKNEEKPNVCGPATSDVSPEMDRFHTGDCGNMDNEPSPESLGEKGTKLDHTEEESN